MQDDDAFLHATDVAGSDKYLGDYKRMQAFLKARASEFLKACKTQPPAEAARPVAQAIARVMLGDDPDWVGVPGWHERGSIDFALARAMGVDDGSPEDVLEHWAVTYLSEILAVAKYASEEGVTPEQWQWQAQETYDQFTKNALGIPVEEDEEDETL